MILPLFSGLVSGQNSPGWVVTISPTVVFVGDGLNATVHGPPNMEGERLRIQLLDPNGTVIEAGYPILRNLSARFQYQFRLTATPGNYSLKVYYNTTVLVADFSFRLTFDEVNFLAKQQAITDQRVEDLQKQIIIWRTGQQELKQQVDGFWWLPILAFICLVFVLLSWFFAIAPAFALVVALKYPMDTNLTLQSRFIRWFVAPSGAADLRTYDFTRRFRRNPVETDGIVRAFYRQVGKPEPSIPRTSRWGDEHYLRPLTVEHPPMRPLKVAGVAVKRLQGAVPKKPADGSAVLSPKQREIRTLESSIEFLEKKYGEEGQHALAPLLDEQRKRLASLKTKVKGGGPFKPEPSTKKSTPDANEKPRS